MSHGNASELLSATSCPSLSPSPSPYPPSIISEQDFDFCDPRNLTVGSGASPIPAATKPSAAEFPTLPTLCPGDDEEHRFMLGGESFNQAAENHAKSFNFTTPLHHHGLPTFDQFSDLDSEEDFVNGLVNFPATDNVQFFGSKRQRTNSGSDLVSLDHETFIDEADFEDLEEFDDSEQFAVACLPSPPASGSEREVKKEKRTKKTKKARCEEDSSEFDNLVRSRKYTMNAANGEPAQETTTETQQAETAPSQSGSSETTTGNNNAGAGSEADGGTPSHPAVNRRGRKQSLTEDPSKTFICDRCNRRFRRQEHLKRHYRSLHTEDKPFECHDCGKKFSRSDNLSQHARTHGSGAIVMGVLEDGELPSDHMESSDGDHIHTLGSVLFNVAAAASGSDSEDTSVGGSSEADSQSQSRKKRKRSE